MVSAGGRAGQARRIHGRRGDDYSGGMLRKMAAGLVCVAWGLWFGGLGALFLFVADLFAKDRPTALNAAPEMFLVWERYQLVIAAAGLVGAVAWRVLSGSVRVSVIFSLLAVAAVPAALGPIFVTSRMERLREEGLASGEEFKKLHGISMMVYSGEVLVLLGAGVALPWAMREGLERDGRDGGSTT
jgi:hypothetical protein